MQTTIDTILLYSFYIIVFTIIYKKAIFLKNKDKNIFNIFIFTSLSILLILFGYSIVPQFLLMYFLLLGPINIFLFYFIIITRHSFPFYGADFKSLNFDAANFLLHLSKPNALNEYLFVFYVFMLFYSLGIFQWLLLFNIYAKKKNIYLKSFFYLYISACVLIFIFSIYGGTHPTPVTINSNCLHGNVGCPVGNLNQ